jgi:hypothetical protein
MVATQRTIDDLETTLGRVAVALHMQHVMPLGPSWDQCQHPHCVAARRLLPGLHACAAEPPDEVPERDFPFLRLVR